MRRNEEDNKGLVWLQFFENCFMFSKTKRIKKIGRTRLVLFSFLF